MGLDTVELAMEIEEAFSLRFPDAAVREMATVRDVVEFVAAELAREGRPMSREDIFARVQRLTADKAGLDPGDVRWDDRFVQDLGLD